MNKAASLYSLMIWLFCNLIAQNIEASEYGYTAHRGYTSGHSYGNKIRDTEECMRLLRQQQSTNRGITRKIKQPLPTVCQGKLLPGSARNAEECYLILEAFPVNTRHYFVDPCREMVL